MIERIIKVNEVNNLNNVHLIGKYYQVCSVASDGKNRECYIVKHDNDLIYLEKSKCTLFLPKKDNTYMNKTNDDLKNDFLLAFVENKDLGMEIFHTLMVQRISNGDMTIDEIKELYLLLGLGVDREENHA